MNSLGLTINTEAHKLIENTLLIAKKNREPLLITFLNVMIPT